MASKRPYNKISGDETEQSEEGQTPAKINCCPTDSSSSCQQEVETFPEAGGKGNDAGHGNRFQSKLLILYAVRAIQLKYEFYLGTELSVGEKFDDLVFYFKDENDVTFRQQYLQAKHKLNENEQRNKITAKDLLDVKNGNFSLLKYFQSYVKIRSQGNDIEHCIICTNVDFDHIDIKNNGIKLELVDELNWPKLLNCKDIKNDQACYKLKNLVNFKNTLLFKNILICIVNCKDEERKSLFQNCTEVVNGKQFNDHTADEMKNFFSNCQNRNPVGQKLVEFVFDNFLDKLMFAVKTPNEDELDSILTNEVGKYFKLSNAAIQSSHCMKEMVNWFKKQENHWLKAKEAEDILKTKTKNYIKMIELTSFSLDYQKQLKQIKASENSELKFEDMVINQWTFILKSFWDSQEKIKHLSSKTPKLTAVKVISAIKKLPEFPNKDDYLVISSNRLKEEKRKVKKSMKVNGHNLLVVVDEDAKNPMEDDLFYEKFIPKTIKKKVIVISSQNLTNESYEEDTITYEQLNENTKKVLRERQVSFQGSDLTLESLIDTKKLDKVLDSKLIENLLQMTERIVISSFNTFSFEKSLYIERKLKFPSKDQLLNKLADIEEKADKTVDEQMKVKKNKINDKEIEINQNGKIKWKTEEDKRKQEIWKKLKILLEQNNSSDLSLLSTVNERELIDANKKRVIITGVAGTGKSTILSHYYEIIKKNKSDNLVIKISLNNFSKTLKEINNFNDFLIDKVVDQNIFVRSLLKHRLETGDRIILMLDGFDEIDTKCQDKVVELVKTLNESIPLYITTRPHLADQLQFELSQLAYSLDRFKEEDQINYLTSIWKEYIKEVSYNKETIKTFARKLIHRVSETLKDKEKEFIGIPLQCRILAECFQSKIMEQIIKKTDSDYDLSHLLDGGQQFDLANLYKLMIEEKRRVFRDEKSQICFGQSHIVDNSIEKNIKITENHLRKLAIQTIVHQQQYVDILIPFSGGGQSELERKKEEKELNENGIRFGLLGGCGENGIQFLHRTYAEYLMADYVFNGFLLDEENHNKLLENESARKWIIEEMLVKDNYEGVRVFFDSMLKEIILKEEWKSRIQNNHLPLRLHQTASFIFEKKTPALEKACTEINSNISLLIFDCLDVTFHENPSEITYAIYYSFIYRNNNVFRQRIDVFKRLLNYFDNAVNDDPLVQFTFGLIRQLKEEKEQIENKKLERFLVFVGRHVEKDFDFYHLTDFFIRSKMEEQTRKKFFQILTSKFSSDLKLAQLMKYATLERYEDEDEDCWEVEISEIDCLTQVLIILQDLRRIEVAGELSRFLLFLGFETLKKEENANVRLSLEKMGMIGLHGAAFKGDLSLIEKEIGCSLENPENCSEEKRKSVVQLMTNEKIPPFYLAAAYGHEDILKKIFRFLDLKKEISDRYGFLHRSLNDAIAYENVVMIQTILKCVKEINGQNDLVELLQSVIDDCLSKLVVETITSIVVQDTENGYRDLNDLVFYQWTLEILYHVQFDVLQKMISAAGGLDNWIKRLMDTGIEYAFLVLSSDGFLDKLNQENQISKLIDILITKSTLDDNQPSEPSTSYWSDFVKKTASSWRMRDFLAAISKCASEEDLKRLLLYRDDNNILILLQYLMFEGRDDFNKILTNLPENLRKEIKDLSEEEKPKLIDHFFSTPTFLESLDRQEQLNAIKFYLENGNEKQLAKFSQVVKVHQLEQTFQYSELEKRKKIVGLLKKKLDNQTVIKYKEIIEKFSN